MAERLKKDYGVDVEWKAYELRPGTPPEGTPRIPKPGEVNGLNPVLRQYADALGLNLKRSPFTPCSRPALEVAEYARQQGKFDQFHLNVFKAYWEETKNIGLRNVLYEIAQKSGLDATEVERCLNEGRYTQAVTKQSAEAMQLGIYSIPAYVIGDSVITGVQPYEMFQMAIERARRNFME